MDVYTYRLVVCFLGCVSILMVACAGYLAAVGKEVPQVIVGTLSASIGGLLGILQKPSPPPQPPDPGAGIQVAIKGPEKP